MLVIDCTRMRESQNKDIIQIICLTNCDRKQGPNNTHRMVYDMKYSRTLSRLMETAALKPNQKQTNIKREIHP